MMRGTYTGQRADLKGKTALLRLHLEGGVVAQFDDLQLPEASGWHRFAAGEFEIEDIGSEK